MECESSDSELAADKGKPQETANGNDVSHSMERCQRSDSDGDHLDTLNKQGQTNLAPHSHGNRTGAEETPAHSEIGGSTEVSDLTEKTAAMNEKPVARQPAMYMPLQRAPDIQVMKGALPFCLQLIKVSHMDTICNVRNLTMRKFSVFNEPCDMI